MPIRRSLKVSYIFSSVLETKICFSEHSVAYKVWFYWLTFFKLKRALLTYIYNGNPVPVHYHICFILIANQAHSKSKVNAVGCGRVNGSLNGRSSKYDSVVEKQ